MFNKLFNTHHVEVKFRKDAPEQTNEEVNTPFITPEEVKNIATDLGKKIVVGTVIVMTAAAVLGTASKIVVDKATSTSKED